LSSPLYVADRPSPIYTRRHAAADDPDMMLIEPGIFHFYEIEDLCLLNFILWHK